MNNVKINMFGFLCVGKGFGMSTPKATGNSGISRNLFGQNVPMSQIRSAPNEKGNSIFYYYFVLKL